eukprot:UN08752
MYIAAQTPTPTHVIVSSTLTNSSGQYLIATDSDQSNDQNTLYVILCITGLILFICATLVLFRRKPKFKRRENVLSECTQMSDWYGERFTSNGRRSVGIDGRISRPMGTYDTIPYTISDTISGEI